MEIDVIDEEGKEGKVTDCGRGGVLFFFFENGLLVLRMGKPVLLPELLLLFPFLTAFIMHFASYGEEVARFNRMM